MKEFGGDSSFSKNDLALRASQLGSFHFLAPKNMDHISFKYCNEKIWRVFVLVCFFFFAQL